VTKPFAFFDRLIVLLVVVSGRPACIAEDIRSPERYGAMPVTIVRPKGHSFRRLA
jgi:hypothetical protein